MFYGIGISILVVCFCTCYFFARKSQGAGLGMGVGFISLLVGFATAIVLLVETVGRLLANSENTTVVWLTVIVGILMGFVTPLIWKKFFG